MSESVVYEGAGRRALILVHGRDFKPAADVFMKQCVAAMQAGLGRDYPDSLPDFNALDKRLAYYGDITRDFLIANNKRYDEALDVGDRENALNALMALDKRKHFGVARYDRLPGKSAITEFAADVFAPLLSKIGLSNRLIARVGVDLAEYWNPESDFGSRIRARVRDSICEALDEGKELMIVSHGTGCIASYDALWQLSNDEQYADRYCNKKIDMFVTAGAPLGDSMVAKRLLGSGEQGVKRFPTNIVSWHNVSAEDDYVSHDNTLADDFKKMLEQRQVSCIRDYRVYNLAVRYGKSNPHSSLGYLVHPRVAQIISEWLT